MNQMIDRAIASRPLAESTKWYWHTGLPLPYGFGDFSEDEISGLHGAFNKALMKSGLTSRQLCEQLGINSETLRRTLTTPGYAVKIRQRIEEWIKGIDEGLLAND